MKIRNLILIISLTVVALGCNRRRGPEVEDHILLTYKELWNEGDFEAFVGLFHPESQVQLAIHGTDGQKAKVLGEFNRLRKEFGRIDHVNVGRYNEDADVYGLDVTYDVKGPATGFISFKQHGDRWYILDIDVD